VGWIGPATYIKPVRPESCWKMVCEYLCPAPQAERSFK
jgi:hypothetical protein